MPEPVDETTLPPRAPANHGHTRAAWVTTWTVLGGGLVVALAFIFNQPPLGWAGAVVMLLGLVAGRVLAILGHGQNGARTLEAQRARRAH